jgi:cobalt-zinc-cadmium efflux system membrane fusion protein
MEITQQPIVQKNQLRFPAGNPQIQLLVTTPAKELHTVDVDLPAKVVWNEEKTQRLFPAFSGRIVKIFVDIGAVVERGSSLAQVASPDFGTAQAETAKALGDAVLSKKNLNRQKELFEAGVVSQKDYEQAQFDADRTQLEVERARARTNLYGSNASVNQQLMLNSVVRGVVVERNINPEQEIRPDQFGPGNPALFVITDPKELWVSIDARENDVSYLRVGSKLTLKTPSLPGMIFEGQVTVVSDAIDPATRTVKVRAVVKNPQRLLKNEMLATAQFKKTIDHGVIVPSTAVFLIGNEHMVFIQKQAGVYESRAVKIAHEGSREVVLESGLDVGELVVSQNALLLAKELMNAQEEAQQSPMVVPPTKP